jgi:signal transduction histidine kinase
MLKKNLLKYRFLILAILSTGIFTLFYWSVFSSNYQRYISPFQDKFSKQEIKLNRFLGYKRKELKENGKLGDWKDLKEHSEFNLHIYRNDSLLFWNTNQLPIIRFADIHFPSSGIIHLQNGWYYAEMFTENDYVVCASFLIKHDYSYENKDLINEFVFPFQLPFDASISLEQTPNYAIYAKNKDFLFSLIPNSYQTFSEGESQLLLLLLITSIGSWLYLLLGFSKTLKRKYRWLLLSTLVLLRFFSLKYIWFGFMHDTQAFQASLYGTNEWFPNFFEYLTNCLLIVFAAFFLKFELKNTKSDKKNKLLAYFLFLGTIPFYAFLLYLNKGLIENSSIPLIIDRLFSLTLYSVLALISIGFLFYTYFIVTREVILLHKRLQNSGSQLAMVSFFAGIGFFLYEINFGHQLLFASIFPLLLLGLLVYTIYRDKRSFQLGFGMIFLVLFSLVSVLNLAEFNKRKEKSERELYANQLATEQDIVTEVEYASITEKVKRDNFLLNFIKTKNNIGKSDFEAGLERRIFHGYWERYEMNFNLFDTNGVSFITGVENQKNVYDELNEIVRKHGQISEIDTNIFFISDYTGQYSYIIRQPIYSDSAAAILFCTLKSKKIPEEIGFPRLLISSKAQVFESLENYSIAKYHENRLVTKYGGFNYPSSELPMKTWSNEGNGYYNQDGYNHYILEKSKNDAVVLSSKNYTWIELLTSFSYLFSFYGILLLPLLFQFNTTSIFKRTLTLAVKIQLLLIGLVFVSLLAFGWGSGIFVRNQYNEYTNFVIREKLASVDIELRGKLGSSDSLSIHENGNYVAFLLQKFSKVFVTDINFYDVKGQIIGSSRPKVFNMGLLSEQMNPKALHAFIIQNKSEFVHEEKIGKLNFASAYLPFYNHEAKLLGFANLQHFGKQKEFENQIQKFLVAIINVFMLLLAISIVLAIFISNWVTAPLRILQENFSKIRFGKYNQQISYDKEDEIGALVKDYNQKLQELEYTAQQLAQSERESAWREMAKQVAHEIKNPLTPMKLSIQHLLRVYDPNDPNSEQKLKKVATSIVEQIDALTRIANEFSNFAKMPRPQEVTLDLIPIIENVLEVFKEEATCEITLVSDLKSVLVNADKDQMIRTFNNLLKNAIQSIPEESAGKITIYVERVQENVLISIKDSGTGIPKDQIDKIFVPYFTTKTGGTGLGLAMVKQIIENHNGTISFETREGEGTIFTISLPEATENQIPEVYI